MRWFWNDKMRCFSNTDSGELSIMTLTCLTFTRARTASSHQPEMDIFVTDRHTHYCCFAVVVTFHSFDLLWMVLLLPVFGHTSKFWIKLLTWWCRSWVEDKLITTHVAVGLEPTGPVSQMSLVLFQCGCRRLHCKAGSAEPGLTNPRVLVVVAT